MAKRSTKTTSGPDETISRGTGNVLADLGDADAEERQTKLRLAHAINGVIARRRLTQAAAAEKLGVNQPKVSALANYRLDGFSVERLMTFLTALDQDVEIVIRKKPRSRAAGQISVVAARARRETLRAAPPEGDESFADRDPAKRGRRRTVAIELDKRRIARFCQRHRIKRLSLFGSVLRDDFTDASDVDVLVEFMPGAIPGLAFFAMEDELSRLLGRKVDLNTPGFLSPDIRAQALAEAEVQYERA